MVLNYVLLFFRYVDVDGDDEDDGDNGLWGYWL